MNFIQEACNEAATDRGPGSFMQVKKDGTVHVMHYADRTVCGIHEAWMNRYNTFDEDEVIFNEKHMPKGAPCKSCFSALAAEARRIYEFNE